MDPDLRVDLLRDALGGAIGAFDAYGKALRARRMSFASKAKSNLFQDIEALDGELKAGGMPGIEQSIGTPNWEQMKWFFQARHIYTHNAGVVDARFVAKQPSYRSYAWPNPPAGRRPSWPECRSTQYLGQKTRCDDSVTNAAPDVELRTGTPPICRRLTEPDKAPHV